MFHQQLNNIPGAVHDGANLLETAINKRHAIPLEYLSSRSRETICHNPKRWQAAVKFTTFPYWRLSNLNLSLTKHHDSCPSINFEQTFSLSQHINYAFGQLVKYAVPSLAHALYSPCRPAVDHSSRPALLARSRQCRQRVVRLRQFCRPQRACQSLVLQENLIRKYADWL